MTVKALVTGAGGFLGRYIAEQLLARGDQVRGLARKSYAALETLGVESVQGDIRDAGTVREAVRGMDVVFHTAAVADIWGPWEHFYSINVQGTRNVLDACQRQAVRKLVFTSSPSVTFDGVDQCGVDETAPYPQRWLCHYPHTKALAEQAVLAANGQQGTLTCALRPHLIWGPRDGHLIPRLIDRAQRGRLRQVGNGKNRVDVVYVENAAQAHLQAADALEADSPVAGSVYFISQGEPVYCWEWINAILELAGLPPVRRRISATAAWRVGGALEAIFGLLRIAREPMMTRFLAAQLATSHYFTIDRARRDFGYQPTISTEEGMRRLGQWLVAHRPSSSRPGPG
ncbi:MAG: NAD-dependent epimerase/dehydratase family protein [Pirellulaceae bacterium]